MSEQMEEDGSARSEGIEVAKLSKDHALADVVGSFQHEASQARLNTDIDQSRYHAATLWCNRFRVNFATAPLAAP